MFAVCLNVRSQTWFSQLEDLILMSYEVWGPVCILLTLELGRKITIIFFYKIPIFHIDATFHLMRIRIRPRW
jgi:hypothetical protein